MSTYEREDVPGVEEVEIEVLPDVEAMEAAQGSTEPSSAVVLKDPPPCPEGHDARQAAWLGCTPDVCRPGDVQISEQYRAERGE